MDIWLLLEAGTLLLFKVSEILLTNDSQSFSEVSLFSRGYVLYSIVIVSLLFPFFAVWSVLGIFWYAEVICNNSCFNSKFAWYFLLWLIFGFLWTIGHFTCISYSFIKFFDNFEIERQYNLLLDQYEGIQAPLLNRDHQGLSPESISKFDLESVTVDLDYICSICLDSLHKGDKARILPCFHKFHLLCVDNWLMRKANCPNCLKKF